MNLFFMIDDHSDVANGPEARKQADIIMDVFRDPSRTRPKDEWIGGEMSRQ